MGVQKVNVGDAVTPDWRNTGCALGQIVDTFDRADGTAVVADRSDGGLWTLPAGDLWEIQNNRLVKNTNTGAGDSIRAEYGPIEEILISSVLVCSDPYAAMEFHWAKEADGTGGFGLEVKQYERFMGLTGPDGSTLLSSVFTIPDWEDLDPHPITIRYNRVTGHCVIHFEGADRFDDIVDIATGTWLELNTNEWVLPDPTNRNGWNELSVTGTVSVDPGRLKLWSGAHWVREVCDDDDLSGPDWLQYKTFTPPTAAGLRSITFDTPIVLSPGVDYWYVLQNNATDAHAQGTSDPNLTFTNISVTPGMFYSFSGGGFGSASSIRYPIFGTTASTGTAPELGFGVAPSDYWGPSSIAQLFQVTSTVTVTGLTQYWGGNAGIAGKWGIARSLHLAHPLKVNVGTPGVPDWQIAACMIPA